MQSSFNSAISASISRHFFTRFFLITRKILFCSRVPGRDQEEDSLNPSSSAWSAHARTSWPSAMESEVCTFCKEAGAYMSLPQDITFPVMIGFGTDSGRMSFGICSATMLAKIRGTRVRAWMHRCVFNDDSILEPTVRQSCLSVDR